MFSGPYFEWSQKRAKGIIDFYGHKFFFGKQVLDLGCGHADISGVLYRLGSVVTAVDVRQEHLKTAAKKFPGIQTIRADLDQAWPFQNKKFDLIIDMGLICHLGNFEEHLKAVCASTNALVLETAVCDSFDPEKNSVVSDNRVTYDGSPNGIIAHISDSAVERVLKNCGMTFKRMDNAKFNSGEYVYDWQAKFDGSFNVHKRRIWFAVKANAGVQTKALPDPPIQASSSLIAQVPANFQVPLLPRMVASPKHPNGLVPEYPVNNNLPGWIPPKEPPTEKKKIKTALCISGHLRTFDANFKSLFDNILSQVDCDVFIHTWETLGVAHRNHEVSLSYTKTNQVRGLIENMYRPKKIVIEPNRSFEPTPLMRMKQIDHRDVSGILSMYYKIEACNDLKKEYEKENNFKYDCVIRFRTDLFLEQPIPVDYSTNLSSLHIPVFGNFAGLNDQIAFGSSEVMDKYASLYSNIEANLNAGAVMHPEKILLFHVEHQKIPVTKVHFRYVIKRGNGIIQNNMLLERALGFIR